MVNLSLRCKTRMTIAQAKFLTIVLNIRLSRCHQTVKRAKLCFTKMAHFSLIALNLDLKIVMLVIILQVFTLQLLVIQSNFLIQKDQHARKSCMSVNIQPSFWSKDNFNTSINLRKFCPKKNMTSKRCSLRWLQKIKNWRPKMLT